MLLFGENRNKPKLSRFHLENGKAQKFLKITLPNVVFRDTFEPSKSDEVNLTYAARNWHRRTGALQTTFLLVRGGER
jgi:hypothetical protein